MSNWVDEIDGHSARPRRPAVVIETRVPADSPWAGKPVADLAHHSGAVPVALVRDGQPLPPDPADRLGAGDCLVYLVAHEAEADLIRRLHGHGGPNPPSAAGGR
ncbi:MAG: hypothetical protein LBH76_04285 [Propionibacteriaceae bacterium]|jgi:trk system potassium uptake protein TrkA|nr:hypothetical protein [Propionibacteriaceae bacterium]